MIIKEISEELYSEFASTHLLSNEYQTSNYANLKKKQNYEVMYIGCYYNGVMVGAFMMLIKLIAPTIKYGYSPRGFLVDYYDKDYMTRLTKALKSYFVKKNFAFIKLDPEIIYSVIFANTKSREVNALNKNLVTFMQSLGYQKLKPTLYFDSMMPTYNPIIDLTDFKVDNLSTQTVKELNAASDLGLTLRIGNDEDIDKIYSFIKNKKNRTLAYYKEYYKAFTKEKMDVLLLELDYNVYLKVLQENYAKEEENNSSLNKEFITSPNDNELFNKKMLSDKTLSDIKKEIVAITNVVKNNNKFVVAGALASKHNNRVNIIVNGHDKNYPSLNSKLYLFYNIIKYYKEKGFEYLDMNGITIDFTDENPYKNLNNFKLKFNPTIYEYIGEFDLVINNAYYQMLWNSGKLHKEFQKERVQ